MNCQLLNKLFNFMLRIKLNLAGDGFDPSIFRLWA